KQLHVAERSERLAGVETLTGPRLVPVDVLNAEKALPAEVERRADTDESFFAVLHIVVPVTREQKRVHPDQPVLLRRFRIETDIAVEKRRGEAGAVVERRVGREATVVVFELRRGKPAARLELVGHLCADAALIRCDGIGCLREERARREGLRRARLEREICTG